MPQNNLSNYLLEIQDSDMVIVTEGNYLLSDKKFKPDQIVIDLWHGFPIKSLALVDKQEKFKYSISSQWKPVNYLASYSDLLIQL